jgi:PAS domain S-box-containing protein
MHDMNSLPPNTDLGAPQTFAGCASFRWDSTDDTLTPSPELVEVLGSDAAPANLAELAACFNVDVQAQAAQFLRSGLGRTHPQEMEFQIARAGCQPKTVNIRLQSDHGKGGQATALRGLVVDVTQSRQRTEDKWTERFAGAQSVGHYHFDVQQRLSWWSRAIYEMFDLTPQAVPDPFTEMMRHIHPEDRPVARRMVEQASTTLGPFEVAYRLVRPDGTIRTIIDRGETEGPIDPETGLAREVRGVMIDTTQEQILTHSATLATQAFEQLIAGADFALYRVDADLRIVQLSEGAQEAFAGVENVIGRDLEEVLNIMWPKDFADHAISRFRHTLATGEPSRSETVSDQRKDLNAQESYDWTVQRITAPDGTFGAICHFYDLTAMTSKAQSLRENRNELQMILDNAVAFIGVLDLDGTLREVNQPALIAGGLTREDVIDNSFWDAPWWRHNDDEVARLKNAVAQVRDGAIVRYDANVLMRDNVMMTIDFLLSPIRDASGTVIRLVASGFDITERKKSEDHVRLLMGEINHRSKNVLSLVQSIARLASKSTEGDFLPAFEARLQALSSSYDLLLNEPHQGVAIGDLVTAQLAHVSDKVGDRIVTKGPALKITAEAAQGLGMAIHELATNAAKYGALSTEDGCIEITWSRVAPTDGADAGFEVLWQEVDGPPVTAPSRKGFGSTVLGPMAQNALHGSVDLRYDVKGVRWHVTCGPQVIVA